MIKRAIWGTVFAVVFAVSMLTSQVLATSPHDPREDVTNGNANFDIKKFGTQGGNPYVQVYGTAGGTTQPDTLTSTFIFVYRLDMNDGTSFIVTSHGMVEDSTEVVDDTQYHAHHVVFTAGCISAFGPVGFENGDAKITPHRVTVENAVLGGATITGASTGIISVPSLCQTVTWDS